jgi:hypothetical protein
MSKMIDGNKLILALSDWWYSSFGLKETEESKAIHKVLDEVEKYVEHEKSAGGWIPCSERLPSAEDCPMDCMVTRRSKYVGNYTDMAVAEADGTWTHEDWKAIAIKGEATCISTRDADIIAWMPLPKPYREDGEA